MSTLQPIIKQHAFVHAYNTLKLNSWIKSKNLIESQDLIVGLQYQPCKVIHTENIEDTVSVLLVGFHHPQNHENPNLEMGAYVDEVEAF